MKNPINPNNVLDNLLIRINLESELASIDVMKAYQSYITTVSTTATTSCAWTESVYTRSLPRTRARGHMTDDADYTSSRSPPHILNGRWN